MADPFRGQVRTFVVSCIAAWPVPGSVLSTGGRDRAPKSPHLAPPGARPQANPFEGSSLYDLNTTYVPPDLIVHEEQPDAVVPAVPVAGAAAAAPQQQQQQAARGGAPPPAGGASVPAVAAAPLQFTGGALGARGGAAARRAALHRLAACARAARAVPRWLHLYFPGVHSTARRAPTRYPQPLSSAARRSRATSGQVRRAGPVHRSRSSTLAAAAAASSQRRRRPQRASAPPRPPLSAHTHPATHAQAAAGRARARGLRPARRRRRRCRGTTTPQSTRCGTCGATAPSSTSIQT